MNKFILVITFLIFSLSTFAQTYQESFSTYTEKGKSYLGFDLGYDARLSFGPNGSRVASYKFRPGLSYQYNVMNRLSIGGKISNTTRLNSRNSIAGVGRGFFKDMQSIGGSIFVRYYPFKRNGFFVEGEYIQELNFSANTNNPKHVQKFALNPGYTFMIGKNKNIALDLKMNLTYQPNEYGFLGGFIPIPTIGTKIPIGKSKMQRPIGLK